MIDPLNREIRRGLLINITGNGKGKTTSALGTAVRALGWGWQVKFLQFVKDGRETGEKRFFAGVPGIECSQVGCGFSIQPGDHAAAAAAGWREAAAALQGEQFDLVILDELNVALQLRWLKLEAVLEALRERPAWRHVIVTGRQAPPELLAMSDLVSEVREIRHPFHAGIAAQPGIEY
jgi:cob(I)alamin adenosyltransferase